MVEQCTRVLNVHDAEDLLKRITTYDRVQGSTGLVKSVREIAEFIESLDLEVLIFEIPVNSSRGFVETPTSWELVEGYVEVKYRASQVVKLAHPDRPTLVAAHSPPGEGCGELKLCKDIANCEGDVVLVKAPPYLAYKEIPADLIVLYDDERYVKGVPYTGLFINTNEVKKTCVVNIPYLTALKLISLINKGEKIEICWKIDAKYSSRPMYGLLAYEGKDPGILYTSHICHPKPGAHDNASGTVANVLSAKILSRFRGKISHAHLLVPEYSGTVFAYDYLPWKPVFTVNLDMVGSKQHITGSTLNIVNAPLFARSVSSPYIYVAAKLVLDKAHSFRGLKQPAIKYSLSPFTSGSDHDVMLMWGLDSAMLNEWPSKYYHTDMDDYDTISPRLVAGISVLASLAGLIAASDQHKGEILRAYFDFVKSWYAVEALKYGVDASGISKVLDNQVVLDFNPKRTPITSRHFYKKLGATKYLKMRGIKGAATYLSVYAPLAYVNNITNSLELFQLENLILWSNEEKRIIQDAWLVISSEVS